MPFVASMIDMGTRLETALSKSSPRCSKRSIGRRSAVLGRQGGDEFVILLPGIDLKAAVTIAEGLCEACEARALVHQDPAAKFTISVGVGTEASGASELGGLLRQTDAALYRAKRAGGNQVASGPGRFVQRQSAPELRTVPDALGQTVRTPSTSARSRGSVEVGFGGLIMSISDLTTAASNTRFDLTLWMTLVLRRAITRSLSFRLAHVSAAFRVAVIPRTGEMIDVRVLIDPNDS